MKLGVLTHPTVAVVNVGGVDVHIGDFWQHVEPFLEELGAEPVVRTCVCEIHHELKRRMAEGFQCKNHMVN